MLKKLRYFGFSAGLTIAALVGSFFAMSPGSSAILLVLILVELTFSFDNAVINAKVLQTLSERWRFVFLTVGIVIAIVGMRIIFPILIVSLTANLAWREVLELALHHPEMYAAKLTEAHPLIASYGGAFLLMLCLHFFFDANKQVHWFRGFEMRLQQWGRSWLPAVLSVMVISGIALLPANHHGAETFRAGLFGVFTYVAIRGIEALFSRLNSSREDTEAGPKTVKGASGKRHGMRLLTGWSAFATFVYLEVLDASFSFDGVIGAFAITQSVILIALGLGVGAIWVRSLTVYMVKAGTLSRYKYLEHGAHYTVGVLAMVLFISLFVEVPDVVTGLAGIAFVCAAFVSSRRENARTSA
jgi:hypothetical protein